jgi:hypothetical protein
MKARDGITTQCVLLEASVQTIAAGHPRDQVLTGTAEGGIVAGLADQQVATVAAVELVVSVAAVNGVSAIIGF